LIILLFNKFKLIKS